MDTESCGGGIRFLALYLFVWGYVDIYMRKKYVVELWWAHEGGGRAQGVGAPPPSWAPRSSTDVLLPPIYTYVPPNEQIQSQKPNSTTATFCIHEIPSWGRFRRAVITEGFYIIIASPMKCE